MVACERFDAAGKLISISVRTAAIGATKIGYVAHLLLGLSKGWAHNLALRLWKVDNVDALKPYQLTAIVNELRAQSVDKGITL